ncbi:hypothetical protein KI387_009924, partial [Taxus chinensis]
MRGVRGSGVPAEIGTVGPFGLGTFGTKVPEYAVQPIRVKLKQLAFFGLGQAAL